MDPESLLHVLAAAGLKTTAISQEGADSQFVGPQEPPDKCRNPSADHQRIVNLILPPIPGTGFAKIPQTPFQEPMMKNHPLPPSRSRKGQGATEYVIILVLVAIASISVITVFGDQLRELFSVATKRLQGDSTTQPQQFDASADVQRKLDNF